MNIFSMAVSTIYLCFCKCEAFPQIISHLFNSFIAVEDLERNDGTMEKPYFMSAKLKNLLIEERSGSYIQQQEAGVYNQAIML